MGGKVSRDCITVGGVTLKPQEVEVLALTAAGLKNQEIAARMGFSTSHVEAMLGNTDRYRSIYTKIGVRNRSQAVAWFKDQAGLRNTSISLIQEPSRLSLLPEFLALIDRELERNQQAIDKGMSTQAAQWLAETIPVLRSATQCVKRELPAEATLLQERLSRALWQYGQVLTFWSPHQVEKAGD
jgi:DNA-binding CsgD family transcriptional regulator